MFVCRNPGFMPGSVDRGEQYKTSGQHRLHQLVGENFTHRRQVLSSSCKTENNSVDNDNEEGIMFEMFDDVLPPLARTNVPPIKQCLTNLRLSLSKIRQEFKRSWQILLSSKRYLNKPL